jgi:hypothetical protein
MVIIIIDCYLPLPLLKVKGRTKQQVSRHFLSKIQKNFPPFPRRKNG